MTGKEPASPTRNAAILLLTLEKPLAAEVLSQLPKELVEKVTLELAKVDEVSKAEQDTVIDEFHRMSGELTPIEQGGLEFAGELLQQSLGPTDAGVIMDSLKQTMTSVPFGFLSNAEPESLLTFIVEEHPQTISLILSHLPQSLAAEVLSGLPVDKQMEVVQRVANMEQTNPDVIRVVEESLKGRMVSTFSQHMEKAGGVPLVAQILNVTDRMTNRGILESLEQQDAELVEEIRRLMFVFDDILKLDDKSIQSVLKEVETAQWAVALKGASEEIKSKITGNMSQRAAEMLLEEMDYLGPVRVSDVESMQQQVVDAVRRLEDAGEVVVSSGGEAEEFLS
jgi:flagellar motor switch protein FliG